MIGLSFFKNLKSIFLYKYLYKKSFYVIIKESLIKGYFLIIKYIYFFLYFDL